MSSKVHRDTRSAHGFAAPGVRLEQRPDGAILLRSTIPIGTIPRSAPDLLDRQAERTPDRPFMRQRLDSDGPWREITYRELVEASRSFAQWLLDSGHRKGDTIAVLSGPSIEHVIVLVGAQRIGVGAASLSTNFSLLGKPEEKLASCMSAIGARYAFVDDSPAYATAMRWLAAHRTSLIAGDDGLPDVDALSIRDICATPATNTVDQAFASIDAATVARIMFTSGSTGMPKAVALTNGSLMASVAQMDTLGFLPRGGAYGPQILDFMPYSHILAGAAGLNNAMRAGATINLDAGKPTPQHFHQTISNLREISPSWFMTAPIGYSMLVDAMEDDVALRRSFFRELRYMLFSGATLPQRVRDRLNQFSKDETGHVVPMTSAYGATEILASTFVHWDNSDTVNIGLPAPGVEIKLAPYQDKYEIRVRGPNIMLKNGYIGDATANAKAFDEEGYFKTGDAARLLDVEQPELGLQYDGRFGEQFKLTSATYVAAGSLRVSLLAAFEPLLRELCLCGENKDYLAAVAWLNEAGVRSAYPDLAAASAREMISDDRVQAALRERLRSYNAANGGSSRRIERILLSVEPLSFDFNEITDKGSINMRRVWQHRPAELERLFSPAIEDAIDMLSTKIIE